MRSLSVNVFIIALVILLGALQYVGWFGRGGRHDVSNLKEQIAGEEHELETLRMRNSKLAAEVVDLKQGTDAIEEIARNDMGMIKDGEVFYQFIDAGAGKDKPDATKPTP
jgi:cell division protein FtsB